MQYQICEGSHNAKVLQLAWEAQKFQNSLIYYAIHKNTENFF